MTQSPAASAAPGLQNQDARGSTESGCAPVVALKRPPSEGLVTMLRALLEKAESGEIVGAAVFTNAGDGYSHAQQGHMPFETALLCIESWKFRMLAVRELEQG